MTRPKLLAPIRTAAPVNQPLSLAEVRAHLRIEHTDEDAILDALIDVATAHVDGWTGVLGRALVTQTWAQSYDDFPCDGGALRLPLTPCQSVDSVTYHDADGIIQTLSADTYYLTADYEGAGVWLAPGKTWPATQERRNAVKVTAIYGYGDDADDVPRPIRQAMLLMISDLYEHRETVAIGASTAMIPMSATVERLLAPYRRISP